MGNNKRLAFTRVQLLQSMPFITKLEVAVRCDAYRTRKRPEYVTRSSDPKVWEPWRCKLPAYWQFEALEESRAKDGKYCMLHLWVQTSDRVEYARFMEHYNRYIEHQKEDHGSVIP